MKRALIVLILFFIWAGLALAAEQKPLKPEEVLKLKNIELTLQNMELQAELIRRDLEKVRQERESYLEQLQKTYKIDEGWRIDLQKGILFREESPGPEKRDSQQSE